MPRAISQILDGFVRSGKRLHRSIILLGPQGEMVENTTNPNRVQSIKVLFENRKYHDLVEFYLPYAQRQEIIDSNDLYLLTRAMLNLKQSELALRMLQSNQDVLIHHRVLMFEYIVLCARMGDSKAMNQAIEHCEIRYGRDSTHSKILQALIISETETDDYISKMEQRYGAHAPYEILRAAYATRNRTLMERYVTDVKEDARSSILKMRCLIFLGDTKTATQVLSSLKPSGLKPNQTKEIIRISLQLMPDADLSKWANGGGISPELLKLEIARNQLSTGILEGNFEMGVKGLESLLQFENPARTQILRLIRTGDDYQAMFEKLMSISGINGYMLQMVGEFAIQYSFKDISLLAIRRLECLMLCDLGNDTYQTNYIEAVRNSGDLTLMSRAYNALEHIPNPNSKIFEFASYFSKLKSKLP